MLTENMLWAWNVDIFVRLDLRGWAPPLLHITTLTTATPPEEDRATATGNWHETIGEAS